MARRDSRYICSNHHWCFRDRVHCEYLPCRWGPGLGAGFVPHVYCVRGGISSSAWHLKRDYELNHCPTHLARVLRAADLSGRAARHLFSARKQAPRLPEALITNRCTLGYWSACIGCIQSPHTSRAPGLAHAF